MKLKHNIKLKKQVHKQHHAATTIITITQALAPTHYYKHSSTHMFIINNNKHTHKRAGLVRYYTRKARKGI